MNLELTEREARLMRAQLVRHIVELEDELTRSGHEALARALAQEIRTLRDIQGRLAVLLDADAPSSPHWQVASPSSRPSAPPAVIKAHSAPPSNTGAL
jgi:hypothetical protein